MEGLSRRATSKTDCGAGYVGARVWHRGAEAWSEVRQLSHYLIYEAKSPAQVDASGGVLRFFGSRKSASVGLCSNDLLTGSIFRGRYHKSRAKNKQNKIGQGHECAGFAIKW